ncbi:MAG: acyl-CoA thioesterase [Candidatus Hodarchaeota archaeon]
MRHCSDEVSISQENSVSKRLLSLLRVAGVQSWNVMELQDTRQRMFQREIEISIRVRYCETDQMGVVHHSNYFRYFEVARMEHFRSWGYPYGEVEGPEILLMIIDMQCRCRSPAYFDEVIQVKARIHKMTRFRIVHHYEIRKKNRQIIATGKTVLASANKEGFPVPLPETFGNVWLNLKEH